MSLKKYSLYNVERGGCNTAPNVSARVNILHKDTLMCIVDAISRTSGIRKDSLKINGADANIDLPHYNGGYSSQTVYLTVT